MHHIDQNIVAKEFLFSKEELLEIIDVFGHRLIFKNISEYSFVDLDGKNTSIHKVYAYAVNLISLTNKFHILDSLIRRNKYTLSKEDIATCKGVLWEVCSDFLSVMRDNSINCPNIKPAFREDWDIAVRRLNWNKFIKEILTLKNQFDKVAGNMNISKSVKSTKESLIKEADEYLVIIFTLVLNYISKRC